MCEAKESGCPDRAECDLSGDDAGSAGSAGMRDFAQPGDRAGQRIESADIGIVSSDDRIKPGLHYFGGTSGNIRRSMRKGVMKQEKRDVQDAKARSDKIPRILIAAPGSGSGKSAVTCALMAAFLQEGIQVAACKCGPDYIDPMFHREVLGIPSENLDLCEKAVMRELLVRPQRTCGI